jgi:hypothetical protein
VLTLWRAVVGGQAFRMAKKRDRQRPDWKGEEVARQPGDQAEKAAERAEGNERVRADAEAARLHHPEDAEIKETPRPPSPDADPEEEIREVAEEHRDRRDADGYPPRGKL